MKRIEARSRAASTRTPWSRRSPRKNELFVAIEATSTKPRRGEHRARRRSRVARRVHRLAADRIYDFDGKTWSQIALQEKPGKPFSDCLREMKK